MLKIMAVVLLLSSTTLASVAIDCGTGANRATGSLQSRTFLLSSESGRWTGPEGRNWRVVDGQGREIKSATLQEDSFSNLHLFFPARSNPDVGVSYQINSWDGDDFTSAAETQVGGFAGGMATGHLDCIVFED